MRAALDRHPADCPRHDHSATLPGLTRLRIDWRHVRGLHAMAADRRSTAGDHAYTPACRAARSYSGNQLAGRRGRPDSGTPRSLFPQEHERGGISPTEARTAATRPRNAPRNSGVFRTPCEPLGANRRELRILPGAGGSGRPGRHLSRDRPPCRRGRHSRLW